MYSRRVVQTFPIDAPAFWRICGEGAGAWSDGPQYAALGDLRRNAQKDRTAPGRQGPEPGPSNPSARTGRPDGAGSGEGDGPALRARGHRRAERPRAKDQREIGRRTLPPLRNQLPHSQEIARGLRSRQPRSRESPPNPPLAQKRGGAGEGVIWGCFIGSEKRRCDPRSPAAHLNHLRCDGVWTVFAQRLTYRVTVAGWRHR